MLGINNSILSFINLSRKYVFLATARCASTSCYKELEKISRQRGEEFITHSDERPDLYHIGLDEFISNFPQFSNFFIFSTVRNPKTIFLSSWYEFGKKGHQSWAYEIQRFPTIIDFIKDFQNTNVRFSIHFRPQYYQLFSNGNRTVDRIMRFENLGKEFSEVTNLIYGKNYYLKNMSRPTSRVIESKEINKKINSFIKNYYKIDIDKFYLNRF